MKLGTLPTKQVDLKAKALLKKIGRHLKHIGKKHLTQNKMTSVEWFANQIAENLGIRVKNSSIGVSLLEQAQTMEKEQRLAPLNAAIAKFEEAKSKAQSLRDVVYLDGVLAVLDTVKSEFSNVE